ncbi:MAG: hypothetical protein CMLOHMNK_00562 [Steroidobacteraceae bacterium]|nr:hypothetical protein [Steroidobacteraceae bacterium]
MSGTSPSPLDSFSLTAALGRPGGELARRHEVLWHSLWQQPHVSAQILELCRLRLAQLHGATRELAVEPPAGLCAGLDAGKRAILLSGNWTRDARLSAAERAALEFAEVYGQDPGAITDELAAAVKAHFSDAGLVALIEALGVIDGRIRLGMMIGELLPPGGSHG